MQTFHANGKLLLSGEYFILDGAKGLAFPTQFGQTLNISPGSDKNIEWTAFDNNNQPWFHCLLSETIEIRDTSDQQQAELLLKLMVAAKELSGVDDFTGIAAETHLSFPINWGLGSSSTLVSLVAQWRKCDPYQLLNATFGGSGYDIACATAKGPITYKKSNASREIKAVQVDPGFKSALYFIHLGNKQNSRAGIAYYKSRVPDKSTWTEQVSTITDKLMEAQDLDTFCYYLDLHEDLISKVLRLPKVKDQHFPDFSGSVKSLGAWGGDFVCAVSEEEEGTIRKYFADKGFSTLLKYSEIIL